MRWSLVRLAVCALVPAMLVASAAAQEREQVALSLEQTLRMALENNLDLVSARMDPLISEQQVDVQRAGFDPTLFAGASHSESEQEISNLFSLNESTSDGASVGVTQNFFFGGDYTVELSGGCNSQSGPLVTADTTYGTTLDLRVNVPLLRGFGGESATEQLILARGNYEISREQLRIEAHRVLESTEAAYWDLVAAGQALRIARLSLARAQDLLELNRKKVEVGTLAPIEITQADAGVASQEEGVIVAETNLDNAEDELRRLLAIPANDPLWDQRVVPADEPFYEPMPIDLEAAIATAMQERPELANAEQVVLNRELNERVAQRNTRPALDFFANFTPSGNNFETTFLPGPDGMIGTPDDITINTIDGRLFESLQEIPDLDNKRWSVGLNFSYPIGNRGARAHYAIARLNREQAEVALQNQEQSIRVDVRRAVRSVESGTKRVAAARVNVLLQQKKLDAEEKKFQNGMSTSFEVLTFQNDLADAELAEIRALIDYNKALVALQSAKGTLLGDRGLALAD